MRWGKHFHELFIVPVWRRKNFWRSQCTLIFLPVEEEEASLSSVPWLDTHLETRQNNAQANVAAKVYATKTWPNDCDMVRKRKRERVLHGVNDCLGVSFAAQYTHSSHRLYWLPSSSLHPPLQPPLWGTLKLKNLDFSSFRWKCDTMNLPSSYSLADQLCLLSLPPRASC